MPIRRGDGRAEQPISSEQLSGAYTEIANVILALTLIKTMVTHKMQTVDCTMVKNADVHSDKP